jgi:hypothetical protein
MNAESALLDSPTQVQVAQQSSLSPEAQQALREALDDEYKARAFYQAVIDKFGAVRPFSNIVESEGRHAAALEGLFAKYGLAIPEDTYAGKMEAPATLLAACEAGIAGEEENRAMYDRLLASVREPDVRVVLERLQEASQQRHLPAFQRCQQRLSRT